MMIASTMPTFAQTVYVEYSEKINTDVPTQLSLKLDNKTYLKIDVEADLSSKKTAVFNCLRKIIAACEIITSILKNG